jgi:hypothetical protein
LFVDVKMNVASAACGGRLEQVQGARCVDVEVDERLARPSRATAARRRGRRAASRSVAPEQPGDRVAVADVEVVMHVPRAELAPDADAVPLRRRVGSEEDTAHVVVDSRDVEPLAPK